MKTTTQIDRQPRHGHLFAVLAATLLASACDEADPDDPEEEELEIAGDYLDEYMTAHVIDHHMWSMSGDPDPDTEGDEYEMAVEILEFDNDADFLVAQNPADDPFNPDLFSRFDWVLADGNVYYCQSVFDAATQEAAAGADLSDPANLATGCGDFSWTNLTP